MRTNLPGKYIGELARRRVAGSTSQYTQRERISPFSEGAVNWAWPQSTLNIGTVGEICLYHGGWPWTLTSGSALRWGSNIYITRRVKGVVYQNVISAGSLTLGGYDPEYIWAALVAADGASVEMQSSGSVYFQDEVRVIGILGTDSTGSASSGSVLYLDWYPNPL